jgi:hypothetical protein
MAGASAEENAMPVKYYLVIDGAQRGPFQKPELEAQGLRRETLVWWKGLPDWLPAGRVPELLDIFDEPPPVPGATAAPVPPRIAVPEPGAPPAVGERLPPFHSEQIKDPAVSIARTENGTPTYAADPDSLPPFTKPRRIPYDVIGLRRLYLGAMCVYVPGLMLILFGGTSIAVLSIHGIEHSPPRFDPQQRMVVNVFDPAARNFETLAGVATAGAMLLGVIGVIIGIVCFCVLLYRAWAVIQDGRTTMTPGKAVGLLFVPFFNTYWMFAAVWGLARALNRFARRYDLDVPTASQPLGFAMGVYNAMCYLPIPFVGLLPLGLNLIVLPFFMRSVYRTVAGICLDANRERVAEMPLEGMLRQPTVTRPVSAHITSIAAIALAPIGTALFVIGFCTGLDALRHYNRDVRLSEANRQGVEHLRGLGALNAGDQNRLRELENRLNQLERDFLFRWRERLIISSAVLGGGVLFLAITIALAMVARACARATTESGPQAPPAWPVTQGAGFLPKNARSPARHSSLSRGAALARAADSIDSA